MLMVVCSVWTDAVPTASVRQSRVFLTFQDYFEDGLVRASKLRKELSYAQ